ncbi:MAG: fibronectin type III domain-containing protein [Bacteroidia bacterium]|nr:fibronectin type III domain-containing protein [Bacteroidia bacterium]
MKKFHFLLIAFVLTFSGAFSQRICGSMEHLHNAIQQDPSLKDRMNQIEEHTNEFVKNNPGGQRVVVTIPVVFHIVYNTAAQNVSNAQIQTQLDVLNADFRKLNTDAGLVPSVFQSLAADCEVNFCMAQRTPTGAATTGIERRQTTVTSFSTNDAVKYYSQGGLDIWDRTKYLNIWVCNMGGGILGYAQFPGGPAATDGVVITYTGFGTTGTATAPFNKGRTATHEVGHWLNLYHIWGDDGTACTGSDNVSDTPNQADENYGCPTFPAVSCSNGPNGDMFMNYMDYTNDACMYMFTAGQKARMQALFSASGSRVGLTTSNGCTPPASNCATPTGLTVASITNTGAVASWAAVSGATSYNVIVGTNTYNTTSTTYTLSGLTACTPYSVSVQAVCGTSGTSTASTAVSFTTTGCQSGCTDTYEANNSLTAAKPITVGTTISALIGTSTDNDYFSFSNTPNQPYIRVTLSNLPANYDLRLYNSANTTVGQSLNTGTTTEVINYNNGAVGTYKIRVNGVSSAFSATSCYNLLVELSTTPWSTGGATCATPTNLAAGSITNTGAVISWTVVSGATSYNLQYKLGTATTWTTVNTTSNSYTLSGLSIGTAYNVQVQAVCSATSSSAYSSAITFTTTATGCVDIYESNNSLSAAKPIAVNTTITGLISSATDNDYFTFTNTASAPNIKVTLSNLPADYDLKIYNSANTTLATAQNSGTANEVIIYNNAPVGTYKLRVYGYGGVFNATQCYNLRADISSSAWIRMANETEDGLKPLYNDLVVYPNPTNGLTTLKFTVEDEDATALITITDQTGRIMNIVQHDITKESEELTLDFSQYASGIYFIQMQKGEVISNSKIIVTR